MPLDFDRLIAVLTEQNEQLREVVRVTDPAKAVPTCPGWTVAALVRHLAAGQRRAAAVVAARLGSRPDDTDVDGGDRAQEPSPAELDTELAESSAVLVAALREAGPDAPVQTRFGPGTAASYARRRAHEIAVHRADATLAVGLPYDLEPEVAADALDEWLELASAPQMLEISPERRALLGPGRTVHLHATDTPAGLDAEWVVDLTGDVPSWRRAHEKSAVAVRGPLVDLLLLVYGRLRVERTGAEVFGDRALLDRWLAATPFG